jgi:hypothetical protein
MAALEVLTLFWNEAIGGAKFVAAHPVAKISRAKMQDGGVAWRRVMPRNRPANAWRGNAGKRGRNTTVPRLVKLVKKAFGLETFVKDAASP